MLLKLFKSEFFKDGINAPSMMRLMMFLVIASILSVWIILNIFLNILPIFDSKFTFGMIDFPPQAVLIMGMIISGKIVQNITESKDQK